MDHDQGRNVFVHIDSVSPTPPPSIYAPDHDEMANKLIFEIIGKSVFRGTRCLVSMTFCYQRTRNATLSCNHLTFIRLLVGRNHLVLVYHDIPFIQGHFGAVLLAKNKYLEGCTHQKSFRKTKNYFLASVHSR
jgi:hypothetical protein